MPVVSQAAGKTAPPAGTWQPVPDLPRKVNAFAVDPGNQRVIYASTGNGGSAGAIYKSEDAGLSWTVASVGLPDEAVTALAADRGVPATLYAAVGNSIFASSDAAGSWTHLADTGLMGGFYGELEVAPTDSNVLFALARPGGAARSRDAGYTWLPLGPGLPGDENELYVLTLAIDPTDAQVVYAGTGGWVGHGHGVYKSINGGDGWAPANWRMLDYRITALAVDPMHPQTLYAGADEGELFKSFDGGQTWVDLSDGLRLQQYSEPRTILMITLDPSAPETLFLLADNSGVLFSADGGAQWRPVGKPGDQDQPIFIAWVVAFTPQPVLIVAVENDGVWRYAAL
jgi:photosystem II stability/assembly factor-like uncharacterized protein